MSRNVALDGIGNGLLKCTIIFAVCVLSLMAVSGCSDYVKNVDKLSEKAFMDPPREARPGALWCWLNGVVDHERMTREMEEAQALGMRGFEIWDVGVLSGRERVPAGPAFLGEESLKSIEHAMNEADRLGLELNMIAASSWNAGGAWVEKPDGVKRIASSSIQVTGPMQLDRVLPVPCDDQTYYRDISVWAVPQSDDKTLSSLETGIDLTGNMDNDGRLQWHVPTGNWTILRFVCRGTNQPLAVPSPNSNGLIIDHLSAGATERHMMYIVNKLAEIDPGHKILKILSHDSYEVHPANDWTEDFADEFKKRRGYDIHKYLPLLEGWQVDDEAIKPRFLADYHKTISDLFIERHFRLSRQLLNNHGMQLCAEAGHGGYARVDPIGALGESDIPRGEFWNGQRHWVTKEAACAANLYGLPYVDSESFTGWGRWKDGPSHYKQLFDVAICDGLNRVTFHTFAHNPSQAGLPGYGYHAGEDFNANSTWWKQSGPMLKYMARCCYMMQQGYYVADVCFYYGDPAPNLVPARRIDPNFKPIYTPDKCLHCGKEPSVNFRSLGSGYGYDYIDANSILKRMTVDPKTGQVVVGNMRYRVMVLPDHDHINLDVLQKIHELIEQGATILGSVRPMRTNSLTDYPMADRQVEDIARHCWPLQDVEKKETGREFGKGRVFTDMTSRQVLIKLGVKQDFTVLEGGTQEGPLRIDSIHRRCEDADVYFVCNSAKETKNLVCRFRDADGNAEIWCPVTGQINSATVVGRNEDGSCDIAIQLPAYGSTFVVFNRGLLTPKRVSLHESTFTEKVPVAGEWTVQFQPGRRAPESVQWNELIDWTTSDVDGIKYFSGTATYSIRYEMAGDASQDWWLDLGQVREVADVSVDNKPLGTAWTYPFRVRIPGEFLTKGLHTFQIKVANVWNNRLVGDAFLEEKDRVTHTNIYKKFPQNAPLVPSGLLGPVTLLSY